MKIKFTFISVFYSIASLANCYQIDAAIKNVMRNNQVAGIAVALVNGNKIYFCNYGYLRKKSKSKINQDTLFEIASLSKLFTADLVALSVINSKLSLDEPISHELSELNVYPRFNNINWQNLLTHTSGLPANLTNSFNSKLNQDALIHELAASQATATNNNYLYSNVGFSLAGIALEHVYHKPYAAIIATLLLKSYGLNHTFLNIPKNYRNVATGYNHLGNPGKPFPVNAMAPAFGLKSCTRDMAKYLKMQFQNQNNEYSLASRLIHQNYYCLPSRNICQQLGWEFRPDDPSFTQESSVAAQDLDGIIYKTGDSNGMTAVIAYRPSNHKGIVVLANQANLKEIKKIAQITLAPAQ